MSSRLMVLGSQFELSGLVQKAKMRGIYTEVLDGYPNGGARKYADKEHTVDVRDYDAVAAVCKEEAIDHIVTSFSDVLLESWVQTAERTGIPCYLNAKQVESYRDKTLMKENFRKLGIHVSEYARIKSGYQDAEIAHIQFPAVLKPVDSYGSRGLHVVYNVDEVREYFEDSAQYTVSAENEALLEELCTGQELNCQACVVDGEVKLISIADRMTGFLDRHMIPINYANVYPSRYFDEVQDKILHIFSKYAEFTGQQWGPMAMQCFWDGKEITVCEIAGRFFGYEHELVKMSADFDIEKLLLDLQYDVEAVRETFSNYQPKGAVTAIGVYLPSVRKGVLKDQSKLRELGSHEGVTDWVLFNEDGTEVDFFKPKQYCARYYVVGTDAQAAYAQMMDIAKTAAAYDANGVNLLFVPKESSTEF